MHTVAQRILEFNKGRLPDLLALKYKAMRANPFSFFRGTCHLFYEDLSKAPKIKDDTKAWICGDLHLENFGTYKGDNRAVYFDMNDFDEAILGPCSWELVRVLSSVYAAAGPIGYSLKQAEQLCHAFLSSYVQHLSRGKAGAIEKDTIGGLVRTFLIGLKLRKREEFIMSRTVLKKGKIKLRIDNRKALKVSAAQKKKLISFMNTWRANRPDKKFFKVLDVAFRIAGTGSLGVERYIFLVKGNGPGQHYLIDLKEASPSCLRKYVKIHQPHWDNEAQRIIQVQDRVQAVPPALLNDVQFNGKHFLLKELQPLQDKMSLLICKGKKKKMTELICALANITASAHIRGGGRQGSSIADDLITFSGQKLWQQQILAYAKAYEGKLTSDYASYCEAYDKGFFGKAPKSN
jgi:uncharacterized protein (DUF2252 family)